MKRKTALERRKKLINKMTYFILITHKIVINQIAKVGKAPDTLARVPEMMDTPPILFD